MNYDKLCAGVFVGIGSLLLIYKGEIASGVGLLGAMVGFFVGDKNGYKNGVSAVSSEVKQQ
jgi:hypothetical protein